MQKGFFMANKGKKEKKDDVPVIEDLNRLLADYRIYDQKLRNYHWTVRGKRFFELHEEFEKLYNQTTLWYDDIAERISRLGGVPLLTLKDYVEQARLEEDPKPGHSDEMVRTLIEDIVTLNTYSAEVVETAGEHTDIATANMLEDMIEQQEENAWMLSAWLNEPGPNTKAGAPDSAR